MFMGAKPVQIKDGLSGFVGLEHRMERAGVVRGVEFINDSKSTNPGALRVALQAFRKGVILIVGGKEKGLDYSDLKMDVAGKVKYLVGLGECGERIVSELGGTMPSCHVGTMRGAVEKAFEAAAEGETVLLSPGTSSYDMYRDFEERGTDFKTEVDRLRGAFQ
jgi:UDP-N-acetylmuramoylalanine--D-glutamate ligase